METVAYNIIPAEVQNAICKEFGADGLCEHNDGSIIAYAYEEIVSYYGARLIEPVIVNWFSKDFIEDYKKAFFCDMMNITEDDLQAMIDYYDNPDRFEN